MTTDPSANRRQDMGKFDVELGCLQRALGLQLRGLGRLQRLTTLIDNRVRDRLGLIQCKRLVGCATVTGGGPTAACGAGLSPQPAKATASRMISGLRPRGEWIQKISV